MGTEMPDDLIVTARGLEKLAELMPAGYAYMLLYLRAKCAEHGQDWVAVTQSALADRVGLTRDSVRRGLARLVKLSFISIKVEGHRTIIHVSNIVVSPIAVKEPPTPRTVAAPKPPTVPNGFIKPTPQEVTAYAESTGFKLNGEEFCAFYESKGWMIGKNHMKNWQGAARTWIQREPVPLPKKLPPKPLEELPLPEELVDPSEVSALVQKLAGGVRRVYRDD